jgi:hypothetical protein
MPEIYPHTLVGQTHYYSFLKTENMKRYLFTLVMLFTATMAFAQPTKKTTSTDKPPTQKEVNDMMKEMQKTMDEMSDEDKKMMDSMGIKMPSVNSIPKMSDKQLTEAWEDENRVVPKRDAVRIAAIPKKVTEAGTGSYIAAIQNKISDQLPPDVKSSGEKVYTYIQSNSKNSGEAGNMASALWIANKPELAVYVMGKICMTDPTNTDNLNNYASMLSMLGAQHLAIPILNNLNLKFPQNSTLLNNLGQAWFGLGEIAKAEKYLDSAIRLYAYHPQANLTKAAIEESRGNIPKAIEALKKSIKHSYTNEKEERLRKLGHKLNIRDIRVPFKPGPDPLGLEKFKRPDYPRSLSELKALKPLWENFNREIEGRLSQLQNESSTIADKYAKDISSMKLNVGLPLHIKKASLQLDEIKEQYEIKFKMLGEKFLVYAEDITIIQKGRKKAVPEAPCEAHQKAEDEYIKIYNERKKAYNDEALQLFRHYFNELAYWSQFTSMSKNEFELVVVGFQAGWLQKLKEYQPMLHTEYEYLECAKKEEAEPGKLSEFDLVACNYNDTLDLKVIAFYNNCSRMTSKLNLKFAEYTRYDDFNRAEGDTYMSSTIKISAEKGFDKLTYKNGPLKVEAKVGASIEMEFDRQGVKDIILAVEAKAGIGNNTLDEGLEAGGNIEGKDVIDTTVEIGVEGRISILSGKGSVKGTGKLENIKITEW